MNNLRQHKNELIKGVITSTEKKLIQDLYKEEKIQNFIKDLKFFTLKYSAAMNETVTKLKILNEDFETRYKRSPIENIENRIKTPESLIKKMIRNDVAFNFDDLQDNIYDIAGVRVICSFVSDVYTIVKMIEDNDEFTIVRKKDYIQNPKPSGYRSLHLIVKVPVYLTTGKEDVYVEIQIRTMAMDFWASLEHKIKYKYDGTVPQEVLDELVECADSIAEADEKMMKLGQMVIQQKG